MLERTARSVNLPDLIVRTRALHPREAARALIRRSWRPVMVACRTTPRSCAWTGTVSPAPGAMPPPAPTSPRTQDRRGRRRALPAGDSEFPRVEDRPRYSTLCRGPCGRLRQPGAGHCCGRHWPIPQSTRRRGCGFGRRLWLRAWPVSRGCNRLCEANRAAPAPAGVWKPPTTVRGRSSAPAS